MCGEGREVTGSLGYLGFLATVQDSRARPQEVCSEGQTVWAQTSHFTACAVKLCSYLSIHRTPHMNTE